MQLENGAWRHAVACEFVDAIESGLRRGGQDGEAFLLLGGAVVRYVECLDVKRQRAALSDERREQHDERYENQ